MQVDKQVFYDYTNSYTLITGAAGAIGNKLALEYAKAHSGLILLDLEMNKERLDSTAKELKEQYSITADTYYVDIRNFKEVSKITSYICKQYDKIDILINNAGINRIIPAIKLTEEDWDTVVDTNLKGTFIMCRTIGEKMIDQENGTIINISSQHGTVANDCRVPYCTSKAGLINMSKCFALEWSRYHIRVNCVSPTFVIAENNAEYLNQPSIKRKYLSRIPLARYCTPEDVADCVMFLSSSGASMITGHNLIVDGGYTVV